MRMSSPSYLTMACPDKQSTVIDSQPLRTRQSKRSKPPLFSPRRIFRAELLLLLWEMLSVLATVLVRQRKKRRSERLWGKEEEASSELLAFPSLSSYLRMRLIRSSPAAQSFEESECLGNEEAG